jgi:hypothetical protein
MASTAENIKMGTCKISFDGTDLGLTMGGVEVTVETTTKETKVDQFGDTVANETIMGRNITVSAPLAETTLDNMVLLMPGTTKIVDGTDLTKMKAMITSGTGISLLSRAKELILHPINLPDSDVSEDLIIPLAATAGAMNFAYKYDEERVFNTTFKGYPDRELGGLLFIYGDKTAAA